MRPSNLSFALTVVVAAAAYVGARVSPVMGYGLAMLTLVVLGLQAMLDVPVWPRRKRREHPIIFGTFWGLMLGLIVPYLVETIVAEGPERLLDLLMSS